MANRRKSGGGGGSGSGGGSKNKPWCWYCDREFDEEKILVQHQRMKHFKCTQCHRKLNSASGLLIHLAQVHKQTIDRVPNALAGHDSLSVEIRGMSGVPAVDLQRHRAGLAPVASAAPGDLLAHGDGGSLLPLLAQQKIQVAAQLAESKSQVLTGGSGLQQPPPAAPLLGTLPIPAAEPKSHFHVDSGSGYAAAPAGPASPADYAYNAYYQQYYAAAYAQQYHAYYAATGYYPPPASHQPAPPMPSVYANASASAGASANVGPYASASQNPTLANANHSDRADHSNHPNHPSHSKPHLPAADKTAPEEAAGKQ